ncbi:MAG: hypothetical protein J5610_02185 [Prevotella sp.]|nr:hypothetical protein [Prevotella sp.]
MAKKVYVMPFMTEVKINSHHILTVSEDVGIHNEVSNNNSYARGYSGCFNDDDEDEDNGNNYWYDE